MHLTLNGLLPAWFLPVLGSAVSLGFYDFCKKHAVKDNAVPPVLFLATLSGTISFVLFTIFSGNWDAAVHCSLNSYLLLLLKAVLVASSWWSVFYAMRDLPLSIAAPIRASAPLWTFLGSLAIYGEIPTWIQGGAMLLIFVGYCVFSMLGKMEGFSLRSGSMHWLIAGTLLGAASALYDKFLLNRLGIPRETVQFYFAVNLIPVLGAGWWITNKFRLSGNCKFQWRYTIVLAGVLLILADYLYFYAVGLPDIKISILSLVRRCGCIVPFVLSALYFHDRHIRGKAIALAVILLGVAILGLF